MTDRIVLSRREVDEMNAMLCRFPFVDNITLTREQVGGIGSILTASVPYTINDVDGVFNVELTNQDNW